MGSAGDIFLKTTNLARAYGRPPAQVHALRDVSLTVRRCERVALVGKSGSGKSTLLNLLGGLDRPTGGSVVVDNVDLARLSSGSLAGYRLRTVGMIFQSFNLLTSRSALDNVALPLLIAGHGTSLRRAAAQRALEAVGLGERLKHLPTELSGGEAQRVALARALVNNPLLLLADEPTGNLDSASAATVMGLLLDHVRLRGATLLLVTHDEDLAANSTDRIVRLQDGMLVSDGG
jgi:predicted ABC-type transport system involved in lysophospholipase L1 biosynthesis ATPase subunit